MSGSIHPFHLRLYGVDRDDFTVYTYIIYVYLQLYVPSTCGYIPLYSAKGTVTL